MECTHCWALGHRHHQPTGCVLAATWLLPALPHLGLQLAQHALRLSLGLRKQPRLCGVGCIRALLRQAGQGGRACRRRGGTAVRRGALGMLRTHPAGQDSTGCRASVPALRPAFQRRAPRGRPRQPSRRGGLTTASRRASAVCASATLARATLSFCSWFIAARTLSTLRCGGRKGGSGAGQLQAQRGERRRRAEMDPGATAALCCPAAQAAGGVHPRRGAAPSWAPPPPSCAG